MAGVAKRPAAGPPPARRPSGYHLTVAERAARDAAIAAGLTPPPRRTKRKGEDIRRVKKGLLKPTQEASADQQPKPQAKAAAKAMAEQAKRAPRSRSRDAPAAGQASGQAQAPPTAAAAAAGKDQPPPKRGPGRPPKDRSQEKPQDKPQGKASPGTAGENEAQRPAGKPANANEQLRKQAANGQGKRRQSGRRKPKWEIELEHKRELRRKLLAIRQKRLQRELEERQVRSGADSKRKGAQLDDPAAAPNESEFAAARRMGLAIRMRLRPQAERTPRKASSMPALEDAPDDGEVELVNQPSGARPRGRGRGRGRVGAVGGSPSPAPKRVRRGGGGRGGSASSSSAGAPYKALENAREAAADPPVERPADRSRERPAEKGKEKAPPAGHTPTRKKSFRERTAAKRASGKHAASPPARGQPGARRSGRRPSRAEAKAALERQGVPPEPTTGDAPQVDKAARAAKLVKKKVLKRGGPRAVRAEAGRSAPDVELVENPKRGRGKKKFRRTASASTSTGASAGSNNSPSEEVGAGASSSGAGEARQGKVVRQRAAAPRSDADLLQDLAEGASSSDDGDAELEKEAADGTAPEVEELALVPVGQPVALPARESGPPPSKMTTHLHDVLRPISRGLVNCFGYAAQQAALKNVAEVLMNGWDLLIAGRRHHIVEMEAYVHSTAHADPYTHGDAGQLESGAWYFHRKGESFKNGSFKGIDLACGGGRGSGVYAGLLVRSVLNVDAKPGSDEEITEGPCLVVDRILKLCNVPSITRFVAGRHVSELPAESLEELRLVRSETPRHARCWSAPRVGLTLREEEKDSDKGRPVAFCSRAYRFSTHPEKLNKWRCGFAAAMRANGAEASEVSRHFSFLPKKLEQYLAAVDAGLSHSDPWRFLNKQVNTQTELCELVGACHSSLENV